MMLKVLFMISSSGQSNTATVLRLQVTSIVN